MELRDRLKQYFKLSNDQKDELLVDIVHDYADIIEHTGQSLKQVIDLDIEFFTETEEFEIVQALTDIKNVIEQINNNIRNGL